MKLKNEVHELLQGSTAFTLAKIIMKLAKVHRVQTFTANENCIVSECSVTLQGAEARKI